MDSNSESPVSRGFSSVRVIDIQMSFWSMVIF